MLFLKSIYGSQKNHFNSPAQCIYSIRSSCLVRVIMSLIPGCRLIVIHILWNRTKKYCRQVQRLMYKQELQSHEHILVEANYELWQHSCA